MQYAIAFIHAVVWSFVAGYITGVWFSSRNKEQKEVKHTQSISLSAEDIIELIRKAHPELKIPESYEVHIDDSDYDDETPVTVTWEN